MMDDVKKRLEAEIAVRDNAIAELKSLKDNLTIWESELAETEREIGEQMKKSEDAMRRPGARFNRIDDTLANLGRKRDVLRDRIERLTNGNLISDAERKIDQARHTLKIRIVAALNDSKMAAAHKMSEYFKAGMAEFDGYNNQCERLFRDLEITGLYAGTKEIAPLPSCPALHQLLENGLLGGEGDDVGAEFVRVMKLDAEQAAQAGPAMTRTGEGQAMKESAHTEHPPTKPIPEPFGTPEAVTSVVSDDTGAGGQ